MVRNNNMIPNSHFHKAWQKNLKLWFKQTMRKERRSRNRTRKAVRMAPKPVDFLRPVVHCPSLRYNGKVRIGRGFSLHEVKAANINKHFALTVGVAVDHRRKNRSLENLLANKQRLLEYNSKLILQPKKTAPSKIVCKGLNLMKQPAVKTNARVLSEEEKEFSAFRTLKRARRECKSSKSKQDKQKYVFQEGAFKSFVDGRKKQMLEDE